MYFVSFVVLGTAPTKGLPRDHRLRWLVQRAKRRYQRRKAAVDWFEHWTLKKYAHAPRLGAKVHYSVVRQLPAFATFRPRITRFPRLKGKEVRIVGSHICYEDCVHLADQAYALLARLERAAAT